jgi:hypothetical protein
MSDLVLFIIGSAVFFLCGLGIVLYGLESFEAWRLREKQPDEDRYLDDETLGQALTDPRRRRH